MTLKIKMISQIKKFITNILSSKPFDKVIIKIKIIMLRIPYFISENRVKYNEKVNIFARFDINRLKDRNIMKN
jgi:hypothetical protein